MESLERMREIDGRLRASFGDPPPPETRDPLELLIRTILSQNTSDRNRDAAYRSLCRAFPTWEEVLRAPTEKLAEAIKPAGLHEERARRIQEVLRRIKDIQGTLGLGFLRALSEEDAESWLLSLPGVGRKTAYIVLLFSLGQRRFPVDTHIRRVTRRLGLWDGRGDPHRALGPLVPEGREYALHLHLIRLGRTFCRPRNPRCGACPLLHLCPHGKDKEAQ